MLSKSYLMLVIALLLSCVVAEKFITINGQQQMNLVSDKCFQVKKASLYDVTNGSGGVLHLYTVPGCHGPSNTMKSSEVKKYAHLVSFKYT